MSGRRKDLQSSAFTCWRLLYLLSNDSFGHPPRSVHSQITVPRGRFRPLSAVKAELRKLRRPRTFLISFLTVAYTNTITQRASVPERQRPVESWSPCFAWAYVADETDRTIWMPQKSRRMRQILEYVAPSPSSSGYGLTNKWQFEVFDTCVLKDEPSLIGIVLRTSHDFTNEPIADGFIVSHVPVPEGVYHDFLLYGVIPKGYLFIRFARQEFGYSLVTERHVHLVSRTFAIGDNVKRQAGDAMIGTIVSIHDSYTLEPICSMRQSSLFQHQPLQSHPGFRSCNETCPSGLPPYLQHPLRHALLYDVPGDELKSADDYETGDYVIERDYLGAVLDTDLDAVLLLENNTVVMVENAWELLLVAPNFDGPIVAYPAIDDIRRPDEIINQVGVKTSIPNEHLRRGQFVITNHRNLRNGRWLHGEYEPGCLPQGHVLDVRTRRAHVRWLCPNAYAQTVSVDRIPSAVRPYDNLGSYGNPRDLRRTKGLSVLDRGQRPSRPLEQRGSLNVSTGQDLEAGDQVRFRDQSGAFVKYQGDGHGQYNRIGKDLTHGYDMNEFIVFFTKQRVRIRWQDGCETEESSMSLKPYLMPEQELCPGDIVTLREGSTQLAAGHPETSATPFNEMIYFQGDYVLRPGKVGVVQSVNARERLVRIRWFIQPRVKLLQQGNVLQRGAYFGPISDEIDDVSLYEIMAHPALARKRRDVVIMPPQKPELEAVKAILHHARYFEGDRLGYSLLSWVRPPVGMDLHTYMRELAKPFAERDLNDPRSSFGDNQHTLDWVGEILDLALDGMLIIRISGLPYSEQIRVPWERILTIVDEEGVADFPTGASDALVEEEFEGSEYLTEGSIISAVAETIEYEGGDRLDDESGDDGWSTDAEDGKATPHRRVLTDEEMYATLMQEGFRRPNRRGEDVHMEEDSREGGIVESEGYRSFLASLSRLTREPPLPESNSTSVSYKATIAEPQTPATVSDLILLASLQTSPPPSFLVLDSLPPPDQFAGPQPSGTVTNSPSASFLKRVHREHRILSTSLPASQIYIRTYESRLDLIRTLILGPADTPYEYAPFLIDLYLPPTYPTAPPVAHFHSWTSGLGRINPNLYEEGKICLSLLDTWPGRGQGESDTWSDKANLLQLLLSLMGLVLVKKPFYNEAGFESYEEEGAYKVESLLYSEKAYVMARGFVRYALLEPVPGLEDVLAWLFLPGSSLAGGKGEDTMMDEDGDDGKGKQAVALGAWMSTASDNQNRTRTSAEPLNRPELLHKLIQRANSLMDVSSACTGEERDELVDGQGKRNAEAFIRPLSQGAIVMLRRHLKMLNKALGGNDDV